MMAAPTFHIPNDATHAELVNLFSKVLETEREYAKSQVQNALEESRCRVQRVLEEFALHLAGDATYDVDRHVEDVLGEAHPAQSAAASIHSSEASSKDDQSLREITPPPRVTSPTLPPRPLPTPGNLGTRPSSRNGSMRTTPTKRLPPPPPPSSSEVSSETDTPKPEATDSSRLSPSFIAARKSLDLNKRSFLNRGRMPSNSVGAQEETLGPRKTHQKKLSLGSFGKVVSSGSLVRGQHRAFPSQAPPTGPPAKGIVPPIPVGLSLGNDTSMSPLSSPVPARTSSPPERRPLSSSGSGGKTSSLFAAMDKIDAQIESGPVPHDYPTLFEEEFDYRAADDGNMIAALLSPRFHSRTFLVTEKGLVIYKSKEKKVLLKEYIFDDVMSIRFEDEGGFMLWLAAGGAKGAGGDNVTIVMDVIEEGDTKSYLVKGKDKVAVGRWITTVDALRVNSNPGAKSLLETQFQLCLLKFLYKDPFRGGTFKFKQGGGVEEEWEYNGTKGVVHLVTPPNSAEPGIWYMFNGREFAPLNEESPSFGVGEWNGYNVCWWSDKSKMASKPDLTFSWNQITKEFVRDGDPTRNWQQTRHFLASKSGSEGEWIIEGDVPVFVVMLVQCIIYHRSPTALPLS